MKEYIHKVQYYETDKMGITHHSNYIRWMEEARVAFMADIGYDYAVLEEMGIVSPVMSVSCDYKRPTTFRDDISINVTVKEYKGVKLHLEYEMKNESEEIVCRAASSHAFLNRDGRPINMKKEYPELDSVMRDLVS